MEGLIPIEDAIRSNNRVIGIAILILVVIAAAVLFSVIVHERRDAKRTRRLIAKAEKRVRKECEKESREKGVVMFCNWMDALYELRITKQELEETRNSFSELKSEYDALVETAKGCPAYGTVGKRGSFKS